MAAGVQLPRIAQEFRAARRNPDLAVLEGFHAVKHALRFGAKLEVLVGTDRAKLKQLAVLLAADLQDELAAELQVVAPEVFSGLAPRALRTGVIGIARRPTVDVEELLIDAAPRPLVMLEDPRSLHNVGACVRVAAAAGAAGLLTTGGQDPWHPDALRAAAGLHFALAVSRMDPIRFADRPVIAVDPQGEPFNPRSLPPRAVLAFGTERHGVSDALLARCGYRVAIPMLPGISSLNLATALAAILFAWRLNAD